MADNVKATSMKLAGINRGNVPAADSVVEAVVAELRARSDVGILKYGETLTRTDWTRKDRLIHALQESLDLSNYLMAEVVAEEATCWQPPESAPRDGSLILGDFGCPWPQMAVWDEYGGRWAAASFQACKMEGGKYNSYFESNTEDIDDLRQWMPMPKISL